MGFLFQELKKNNQIFIHNLIFSLLVLFNLIITHFFLWNQDKLKLSYIVVHINLHQNKSAIMNFVIQLLNTGEVLKDPH